MVASVILEPASPVGDGRQACVVDARLALSRLGLLTVVRLLGEFAVWLPRELREILRDARGYLADPSRLVPRVYCGPIRALDRRSEAEAIGEELGQWNRLPENDALAALPLHYLGERADECFTPPRADRGLRPRYEQLLRGLDRSMQASEYDVPRGATVAACVRDAVALCAALQPYGAFILTRLESDGEGAPALCNYLDAWKVPIQEAPTRWRAATGPLRLAVARASLGPITWAGVQLVAVHVILPGFPVAGGADEAMDDDTVARLWSRAAVFWHRL